MVYVVVWIVVVAFVVFFVVVVVFVVFVVVVVVVFVVFVVFLVFVVVSFRYFLCREVPANPSPHATVRTTHQNRGPTASGVGNSESTQKAV